ncbi:hypothetical protein AAZX31_20G034800 [Glycine max]
MCRWRRHRDSDEQCRCHRDSDEQCHRENILSLPRLLSSRDHHPPRFSLGPSLGPQQCRRQATHHLCEARVLRVRHGGAKGVPAQRQKDPKKRVIITGWGSH